MKVTLNWTPFLAHQLRFYKWAPSKGRFSTEAILGGYGSGKTSAAARKFFYYASRLSWNKRYETRRPQAVIMAPTARILKKATMPAIEELIPKEIIIKKRGAPHPMWLLSNGCEISFVSGDAGFEGENLALMWVDEINHPIFSRNPEKFINFTARIRDPHAKCLAMLVSGLPESGWVRETFDKPGPDRHTLLCGTRDNPHIPPETLQAIMASCPAGFERAYIEGGWMTPPDAVFSQFGSSIHLVDDLADVNKPVHIGLDVGNHGAIVIAQKRPVRVRNVVGQVINEPGVLIVDQVITRDESVDAMCHRLRIGTKWMLAPNESTICVDPTIRRDELAAIRNHFPQVRIIKRDRSHELYPVEAGIRIVQTALRDATGNAHLHFCRRLKDTKYGIIDAIQTARRHERTQKVVKDDSRDHALDALRYVVQELLRPARPQGRNLGRR